MFVVVVATARDHLPTTHPQGCEWWSASRKGCGFVRGSDDDALPCPRLTASGGSNVSTDDGSGCDDGSGGSGGSGGDCLGPGATGAMFSCDTSDEGAMALIDTRHGGTALRHI